MEDVTPATNSKGTNTQVLKAQPREYRYRAPVQFGHLQKVFEAAST
jgi:hypothetical protein